MSPPAKLAAVLLLACLAPAARAGKGLAVVSTCIWRNDLVCDVSPSYIISHLSTLPSSPADSPLAVQALQTAAMEAACNVFSVEADCVAAAGCTWSNKMVRARREVSLPGRSAEASCSRSRFLIDRVQQLLLA
jgi:hypothetical protein